MKMIFGFCLRVFTQDLLQIATCCASGHTTVLLQIEEDPVEEVAQDAAQGDATANGRLTDIFVGVLWRCMSCCEMVLYESLI